MIVSMMSTFGTPEQVTAWYLAHCKPWQDRHAEENLLCQGCGCYRPQHSREQIVRGCRQTVVESLFPGYLFIQLAADTSWAPLCSNCGINRVVGFGNMPLSLDNGLIAHLQRRTTTTDGLAFEVGDGVHIIEGGVAELDAIFIAMDGEQRVILLLDMLNRQRRISVLLVSIVKKLNRLRFWLRSKRYPDKASTIQQRRSWETNGRSWDGSVSCIQLPAQKYNIPASYRRRKGVEVFQIIRGKVFE